MSKGPMITQDARDYRADQKFLLKKQRRYILIGYTAMAFACGLMYYVGWTMIHN